MVAETFHWPCEQCGADLRYAPGQTDLVCDHCGHRQRVAERRAPATPLREIDLALGLRDDLPADQMQEVRTTRCPNCGAEVEFDGASHATECPFCASPVVVDTGAQRHLKPQALVPFVLTEEAARDRMTRWLGRLWFAPSGLVEYARKGRRLTGMYVPFWTFDADTASSYRGARGDHYYETRTVRVKVNGRMETRQERVQKTRWTPAAGRVARRFDDLLVMASTSLPRRLGSELTPWDLGALVPYNPDYLAGFKAEGYTVALADGHAMAREEMARVIAADVRRDIGGDVQRIDGIETRHADETFKHILLPVWMAAYRYNGKAYRFLVNGQTGEVQGERPWSIWKIAGAILLAALLIGAAIAANEYQKGTWAFQDGTIVFPVQDWAPAY